MTKNIVKFLIIGDLHGAMPIMHAKDFDAIIGPGDFCSDESKPLMFESLKKQLKNPKNKTTWYDICGKRKAKIIIKESLKNGRKVLEYLNSLNVPIYITPGNWDWTGEESNWDYLKNNFYKELIKNLPNIIDLHHKKIETENLSFIGHGIISGPEYPQYKQDLNLYTKEQLKKTKNDFDKTFAKLSTLFENSKKPIIFVSHNVPFQTKLDKINNKESPRDGHHFGSVIAKGLIEKYQPLLCIGGHMHEGYGKDKIGKTICINAGFGGNVNTLVEIDTKKGKVINIEFLGKNKEN